MSEQYTDSCGCHIHSKELLYWVHKRFVENIEIVDLMRMAEDDHEREVIGVVALMDVDDVTVQHMITQSQDPDLNIVTCRPALRGMLPHRDAKETDFE